MKFIEVRVVWWPEFWKFYGFLYYCTFRLEAADDVSIDTAHGKDNDQQNLSKIIM